MALRNKYEYEVHSKYEGFLIGGPIYAVQQYNISIQ